MGISVISLLLTAALPVVNVFVMCALGALLARMGILDGRARQLLSQLIFWIFVPTLTFTNLAKSVDLQNLAIWWMLPVNMLISISVGLVIGWIFAGVLKVDTWFRNHFICSVALGNVGNLPLVLASSICDAATPFSEALGADCKRLGIAYIAFGMWIASTFQYCVAFNLMKKAPESAESSNGGQASDVVLQMTEAVKASPSPDNPAADKLVQQTAREGPIGFAKHQSENPKYEAEQSGLLEEEESGTNRQAFQDRPQRSKEEEADFLLGSSQRQHSLDLSTAAESSFPADDNWWRHARAPSRLGKKQMEMRRCLNSIPWGSYLNCPTLSAIAGLTVGCVSVLKRLMFGDSPPLIFVTQSLETMAGGMIPCMMLLLGGSLARGPGASRLPARVIVGLVLVRLLVIPAVGTAIVLLLLKSGAFLPPDILFTLTLFLCHAPPTAMNLQTVATLNQNGEEEMSCLLCWQYLASLITLPMWMSLFVYLIDSLAVS